MTHPETQPAAEAVCDGGVGHGEPLSGESSAEHDPGGTGHGGHAHAMSPNGDRRYLWAALLLMAAFMLGEVVVAFVSGSLALLSDAGHMLSDVGAIGASLWAISLAARPATGAWTFGWKRAEILSAAGNGITLLVVSGIVGYEAIRDSSTHRRSTAARSWWSPWSGWQSTSSLPESWRRPTDAA